MRYCVLPNGQIVRAVGMRLAHLVSCGAYVAEHYLDAIAYSRAVMRRA